MARKRKTPERVKRALKRKKRLRKQMEESRRIVKEQIMKWKTPKKLYEHIVGRKPQGYIKLHRVRGRGGIIFEVQPEEFKRLCDQFEISRVKEKDLRTLGFTILESEEKIKIPEELKGRIGFVEKQTPSLRSILYGTSKFEWEREHEPKLDETARLISHEEHHMLEPKLGRMPEIFKRPEHYKEIFSSRIQGEIGAYLADKSPQKEFEQSLKITMKGVRKRIEREIEEMTYKTRLVEDEKSSSEYKRTSKKALDKSYKEASDIFRLVGECRRKGVPPDVLSQLVITTEWKDLPKTLRRLFSVK